MKTRMTSGMAAALLLLSAASRADLFVSDFSAINGSSGASGVWKNQTTGVGTGIAVALTQTGGEVKAVDHPSQPSITDNSFPWQDNPFPPFTNFFQPNFDGDHINIEVQGTVTASVTIQFNAQITDPVLSFSDVDTQTTLVFTSPFTIAGQSGNMVKTGNTVTSSGANVFIFQEETAGSLQFSGVFTQLAFNIVNAGPDPELDDDRTGFVVATLTQPTAVTPPTAKVSINILGDDVMLSWPANSFTAIERSPNLGTQAWQALPSLNPMAQTTWTGSKATLGPVMYFRGVHAP